jgi:hypothetical protein
MPEIVFEINIIELSLRIFEAATGSQRPKNCSLDEAWKQLRQYDPQTADGFLAAAKSAAEYMADCLEAEIFKVRTH